MWWLLREDKAQHLASMRKAGLFPSAETAAEFRKQTQAARDSGKPRSLTLAGDTAEIRVEGVLTKEPDLWLEWVGEPTTAYRDIIAALAMADADPAVKRAVLFVDSPGGHVDGLFECLAALQGFSKPLTARAAEACSAAYSIACQASKIEATNPAAMFGSVGVAQSFLVWDFVVTVTSTEAPEKRPDVKTDEGKAMVRKSLDAVHDLFVDAIASGRKTTVADVNADFGRGGVVLAGDAKKRGMIDSIAQPALRAVSDPKKRAASEGGAQTRKTSMDEKELKAQHPELHRQVFEAGAARGVATERDRVTAHLTLGKQSGDLDTAVEAVTTGAEMTMTYTAKYMAAGMNRSAQAARQSDDKQTQQVVEGAKPGATSEGPDLGDSIVAILDQGKKKAV